MIKCEVLNDAVIAVAKGSIVIVSQRQFELAKAKLKPVELKKEVKAVEVETAEEPKSKKTRKK